MADTITALFTGDSITDMCRRTDPSGHLGAGYVRPVAEIAAASTPGVRVVNTGISGDRTTDLIDRWDADVIAHRPDILTILIGANDMWRRYDANTPMSAEQFSVNYATLLDAARDRLELRELVIMEPFLVPMTPEQLPWPAEDLDAKRAVAREIAARYDAIFIPLNDLFTARAATDGAGSVIDDGVHPSAGGHELIAQTWWTAVGPLLD
jgi:acyl-CoA thioesterase I